MVKRLPGLAFSLIVACSGREVDKTATYPPNTEPPHAKLFRAMVYSEAFAKQFAAPSSGVHQLDPGLHAVVIRVVQKPGDHPDCFLDLYMADDLDLAFPTGSEGISVRPDEENPFFFVRGENALGAESYRWDAMLGSFHSIACRNGREHCKVDEASGPHAYARHLVPGIALQTYRPLCSAFDPNNGPTEMWLLRNGHDRSNLDAQSTNTDATYRFAMPAALFEHAAQRTREANQYYADHPLGPTPPPGEFSVPTK